MTGKERILAALDVKTPDRVPLYIHGINEAPILGIARHLMEGLPEPKQFQDMTDTEKLKLVDALFLIHEHFGVDGISTFEIGHETPLDETHLMDDWGIVYIRNPHGLPVPKGHPLQDPSTLASFRPPEPNPAHLLLLHLAKERFKGQAALFWLMRGTFVRSWRLVGMENLMMNMIMDPAFVHGIASLTLDYNLRQIELLAEAGLDVLVIEDDIASTRSTLISPPHFREFVHPYNLRLVERAHELGLKVVRHSDGNLWPILDLLISKGYDGLNPLEPQAGMDLKKVKEYCGDRLCLIGNIDCLDLLCHGTPGQVDEAVRQAIDIAAPGGGYILSDSNSLHPGVNPENCIAMFQATKKYGRYGPQ
jgi:uroporphyrinogen decarboxylase